MRRTNMPVPSTLKRAVSKTVVIDYPQRNERVCSESYTIRVSAPADPAAGDRVEVSIDDAPFVPCRYAAGHWWYDWTGYAPKEHQVVARMSAGGKTAKAARRFVVELSREAAAA
jgi:hypothetical protein